MEKKLKRSMKYHKYIERTQEYRISLSNDEIYKKVINHTFAFICWKGKLKQTEDSFRLVINNNLEKFYLVSRALQPFAVIM